MVKEDSQREGGGGWRRKQFDQRISAAPVSEQTPPRKKTIVQTFPPGEILILFYLPAAEFGQMLAKFGQIWRFPKQTWPQLVKVGTWLSKLGQMLAGDLAVDA